MGVLVYLILIREVEEKENSTNIYSTAFSTHHIVSFILGESKVEDSNTQHTQHILKTHVLGNSLRLIGLADDRTYLER